MLGRRKPQTACRVAIPHCIFGNHHDKCGEIFIIEQAIAQPGTGDLPGS
jgi:hypothetical protein